MTTIKKNQTVTKKDNKVVNIKNIEANKPNTKQTEKREPSPEIAMQIKELQKIVLKLKEENEAIKNEKTNIEAIKKRIAEIDELKKQLNIFVASFSKISDLPNPDNVQDFEETHLYINFGVVGEPEPLIKSSNKFITQKFIDFILKELQTKIDSLQNTINALSVF